MIKFFGEKRSYGQRLVLSLETELECTIEIREETTPEMKPYSQLPHYPAPSKPFHPQKTYHPSLSSVRREPQPPHQMVTFHINAWTSNDLQRVKSEIQSIIKDNYTEEEERNSCLEFVDDEDVAKILRQQTDMAIIDVSK